MMNELTRYGLGWYPDPPDPRDFGPRDELVRELLGRLQPDSQENGQRPSRVDLRENFPSVRDQQGLNSSSAHACVALIEYFQRRACGQLEDCSTRFVYKLTRKLLGRTGDPGCDLRTTLKAIRRFGIPPAKYCPDDVDHFDDEPEAFLYSYSDAYRQLVYLRLDSADSPGSETLETVKSFLAAGIPIVFGFSVGDSCGRDQDIPWRPSYDSICGGQAVVAVGYDDDYAGAAVRGALIIRNSWGTAWGDAGYGYLPYRFVERSVAVDFWTVLKDEWLATHELVRPSFLAGSAAISSPEVPD